MMQLKEHGSILKPVFIMAAIAMLLASPVIFFYLQEPLSYLQYRAANLKEGKRLEPAAAWIHNFVARQERLPSREEFKAFREHLLPGRDLALYKKGELALSDWGPLRDDFVVAVSTGEWNLYYCSWSKKTVYVYSE